jgi:hypothetical protein
VVTETDVFWDVTPCLGVNTAISDVSEGLTVFNVHRSVHSKNILIYIQRDATLHSLCYMETALHVSLLLPAAIAAGSSNGTML